MNEEGGGKGRGRKEGEGQGQQQPGFTRPRGSRAGPRASPGIPAAPVCPRAAPEAGRARAAGPAPGGPCVRGHPGRLAPAQSGLARAPRAAGLPARAASRSLGSYSADRQGGGATRGVARRGQVTCGRRERAVGRHFGGGRLSGRV